MQFWILLYASYNTQQEIVVHWLRNSNIEGTVDQHKNWIIYSNSDKNEPKIRVTVLIEL